MKNKYIQIRENDQVTQELKEVALILDIPVTQIAREAIREKLVELKRTHPKLQNEQAQLELNK